MRLRVRVLRGVRNESKAPGGSNKGVRVWARSKHIIKKPNMSSAVVPPGGRARAARRRISKMPLHQFFWCGARQVRGSRQAAGFYSSSRGQVFRWRLAGGSELLGDYCNLGLFCVFGLLLGWL